jgi:hypothetical protein
MEFRLGCVFSCAETDRKRNFENRWCTTGVVKYCCTTEVSPKFLVLPRYGSARGDLD